MSAYSLPDLPFGYDALEPHFDSRTMEVHHKQHHRRYIDRLNVALGLTDELRAAGEQSIDDLLWNIGKISEESRTAVRNYGGGHANHSFFWTILSGDGGGEPTGRLAEAISEEFGSFTAFKQRFAAVATAHVGSGWAWLVLDGAGQLQVISRPNQDAPVMDGLAALVGVDVWEHAYYLKYQNRRADYLAAWWNTINWESVGKRFDQARGA